MKDKLGIVLEGGGAKGAYHIGVYKALYEMGYRPNAIAGTSIGAINGAILAQGDFKKIYDLWYNSSNNAAYGIDENAFKTIGPETAIYAASIIGDAIKSKGLNIDSMMNLFLDIFNEKKLRKSHIDLGIVTVKIPEFKTVELFKDQIPNGELFSYLIASANFPLYRTKSDIDGRFVDGGFKNNLPINMLPKRGITSIIAVRTFAIGVTKPFNNPDVDVTYIEPSKSLGSMLDFSQSKARANLNLGYMDAYRTMKNYFGREFCIIPLTEDFSYLNTLLNTADDRIIRAANIMGYRKVNPKRFLFERLLPQIADYLDLGLHTSYEVVLLSFFEEIAITLNVDRSKIYSADEFIKTVQNSFFAEHKSFNRYKRLPKIIQSNSFLSSFVKSDFFHFIMDIFFQ